MFVPEPALRARRALVALVAFSLAIAGMVPLALPSPTLAATPVFINEFHYDNGGDDAGEFIEVAGPAGTDLTGWSIVLYNGNGGAPYGTTTELTQTIPAQQNGFGTIVVTYPSNGIQNGSPDGVALVNGTTVVQFLSYEGTFTAVGGPANGMLSTDIGVAEPGNAAGTSLSLAGPGTTAEDFTWSVATDDTPGAVNNGQTFGADPAPNVDCGTGIVTPFGVEASTTVTASDTTGRVVDLAITDVSPENSTISVGGLDAADAEGGTASATVTVGSDSAAGSYLVEITATNDDGTPQTGSCVLSVTVQAPTPTGIVISQVYGGGGNSGGVFRNDFIELFNRSDAPIAIDGWSVQYASATGSSWAATALSGTIPAGGYYLVQEAAGADQAQPLLPTPDATGGITMSGTNGKVALAASTTALTGTCPGGVVDFVGYGTANCFEGAAAAPGLSNPTAAIRAEAGCQDTDDNAADFSAGTPTPRNSATPAAPCNAEQAPAIVSTTPVDGAVEIATTASVSLEFSEPVAVTGDWFEVTCSDTGPHSATVSGGPTSFVLDPDADFASGDRCTVTILAAGVADQDPEDPPDAMEEDVTFSFAVGEICGNPSHLISEVQGSGPVTLVSGDHVTIEGVVVGDYQGFEPGLGGFYVQEEDDDADGDPLTSEGIFVNDPATTLDVTAGDLVSVSGTAGEGFNQTAITDVIDVTACEADEGTDATAADVDLPVDKITDLEAFEGMLVDVEDTLTVTETFNLASFGEVVLSVDGRQFASTHVAEPGADAAAVFDLNARSRIILDDGSDSSDDDPTRYPTGGLSAANTLRVGSTVDGITAVMGFGFNNYRLQPVGEVDFDLASRPAGPPDVGGRIQVAAFNVLNYFNGEPAGNFADPDNRGAENAFEFGRQRDKIIEAIAALDAEVVGLMEIENDDSATSYAAIEDLVDGLNAATEDETYAFIETGVIGTDAIAVAIIYQPGEVTPVGPHAVLTSAVDPDFDDTRNRPALAQTFAENATGSTFTVAVNHLKSKGSDCGGAPDDQPDSGGGNCNGTRTLAAQTLAKWLAGDPTGSGDTDRFIIGDLNSYRLEDPIDALKVAGYTDLLAEFEGDDAYTYVFMGWSGYLDHALASASALPQVTDAAPWHINADEPTALDYNTDDKSDGQITSLYAPDEFRASDHDPVVLGLDLDAPPVITSLEVTELVEVGDEVELSATFTDANTDESHTATVDWGDGTVEDVPVDDGTVDATHAYEAAGIHTVTLTVTDSTDLSDTEAFRFAVVFDRAAGFVVGGGRIDTDDGTASFGVSVKYQATGAAPEGDVAFELPDLAFEATSIDWLVVDGSSAWLSGAGTVNGEDGYEFVLAVTDGPDRLRMQITLDDEVVFDNQPGDPIDVVASEPIRNGQIKIQAGRGPGAKEAPGI